MDTKSEKPLVFWLKTENQMLKQRKTATDTKPEKPKFLGAKPEKPTLTNRRTENPNAPLQDCLFSQRGIQAAPLHTLICTCTINALLLRVCTIGRSIVWPNDHAARKHKKVHHLFSFPTGLPTSL